MSWRRFLSLACQESSLCHFSLVCHLFFAFFFFFCLKAAQPFRTAFRSDTTLLHAEILHRANFLPVNAHEALQLSAHGAMHKLVVFKKKKKALSNTSQFHFMMHKLQSHPNGELVLSCVISITGFVPVSSGRRWARAALRCLSSGGHSTQQQARKLQRDVSHCTLTWWDIPQMLADKTQPSDTQGKWLKKNQQQHVNDVSFSVVGGKLVRQNFGFSDLKEVDLWLSTSCFLLFLLFIYILLMRQCAACRHVCTAEASPPTNPARRSDGWGAQRSGC